MSKQNAKQSNANNVTEQAASTELSVLWRSHAYAKGQADAAATGDVPVTDEQAANVASHAGDDGRVSSSGGLLRGIDFEPGHDKPRAVRRGSKSETLLALATRDEGATLYDLAESLSQTGAHVTPSYARAWAARSYIAPLGYGIVSAVTSTQYGPVLRLWAYVSDKALADAAGTEQAATRRDTEQGRERETGQSQPAKGQGKGQSQRKRASRAKGKGQSQGQAASTEQAADTGSTGDASE